MNDKSKTIKLTQGYETIVDAEDYEELNKYKWYYCIGYAARVECKNGKRKPIYMHRIILGLGFGDKHQGDHINHNKLDNRKINLRTVTHQQNAMNGLPHKDGTSKHKGVGWHKGIRRWTARISVNRGQKHLGCFIDEDDAARAYNKAAEELFGEYAGLNNRNRVTQ